MKSIPLFSNTLRAVSLAVLPLASAVQASPPHVEWADNLIANLSPDQNEYGTNPAYVYWAGVDGASVYANRTQCSSFLTRILKKAYQWNDTDFKNWFGTSSPNAATYYDAIMAQNGFAKVSHVPEIQSGDFIAVKYLNDAASSGHVMIARRPAVLKQPVAPYINQTDQYEIEVIDSAHSGHGSTDTRMMADGTWDTGAGIGKLRLYAGPGGVLAGYSWSFSKSSAFYGAQEGRLLVAGRLLP